MSEKKMSTFITIWVGQLFSLLGSGISSFGLSIWVFSKTESPAKFALTFLVTILPRILFAPIAGSLADRRKRKTIIILTDSLDALLKLLLVVLLIANKLEVWMIYPINFLSSTLGAFQEPAFSSMLPLIVPKEQLGRANGMMQFIRAVQGMLAPVLAGALYVLVQLEGLFIIDFVTFGLAIVTILFQKIPQTVEKTKGQNAIKTVVEDFKFSINYIKGKSGFVQLIISFAVLNFIANLVFVLIGPLILSNYKPAIYGVVSSVSGFSMIVGGLIAGIIPAKKDRIKSIFFSLMLSGVGLSIMGISANWIVVAVGYFLFMLLVPYSNGTLGTIMQTKIENTVLGRVGSMMNAMLQLVTPIAIVLAGFLAENIFIPLLNKVGPLYQTWIYDLLGEGQSRGIGLMFIISGLLLIVLCIIMLSNKKVTNLEKANPDVI